MCNEKIHKHEWESDWPIHKVQLAFISNQFPQLSPKVVQKVYDVLIDPAVVCEILKIGLPEYFKKTDTSQALADILAQGLK